MTDARARWIASHPYLAQLASFEEALEAAPLDGVPPVAAPAWDAYLGGDHRLGVPLLRSATARLDARAAAAEALGRIAERAAEAPLPETLAAKVRELRDHLRRGPEARAAAIAWALDGDGEPPPHAGLARFLGWTALARVLAPVVEQYAARHDEDGWHRGLCPTCGALPATGQLVEQADGKQRLLSCPCCRTRWRFRRIGCPYCGNDVPARIDVLELEGDESLRIDACQDCKGYVKTYVGAGDEALLLADWASLHLDVVARERGLERKGASLYEL